MTRPVPPTAKKEPRLIEQLGRTRRDDYGWMKDENWQAVMRDPSVLRADIRSHLEAENAYRKAMLAPTGELQAAIYEEMKGRMKEDEASAPEPDGPFAYSVRYELGAQHPRHVRTARGGGPEELLIDADALAAGKPYYEVGHAGHSPDHRLYAWSEDDQGSEYYAIRIKDLATGEETAPPVASAYGDFAFSADSQWLFWTWKDEHGRPSKIFRRPARGGEDVLVYEEPDEGFFIGVSRTASDRYMVVSAGNQETSEAWIIPCAEPTSAPRLMQAREPGVRYEPEHWNDRWVIRTNAGGALDFKLVSAPEADPSRANWTDLVAHRPGHFIEATAAFRDHFARIERVDANHRITVMARDGSEHEVGFDEEAYALSLDAGFEYDTPVLRFVYESPTTPRQWFDYDMAGRTRTLVKTQEIPSGHDPARYITRRLQARAPDGELVPVTVLMARDTKLDGSAPLMAYGYGSYGHAIDPNFSIRKLSLVDRGWIWADLHVRGGSEKGWGWFLDGRKDRKLNSFTDFIAATEHLHANGYGAPATTVAQGRSAGGLLMGAVANMRPDLYIGILGGVPFVDLINTMSDVSLPLTPPEWPEWGDPTRDPAAYDYMMSYSPYDNVADQPYPAVLATGGLSDPRVTYWEPSKWAAKLREHSTSGRPILLKINMTAGHFSSAGRFAVLHDYAEEFAWCVWAVERGWEAQSS
jgi:oligopeptidase B